MSKQPQSEQTRRVGTRTSAQFKSSLYFKPWCGRCSAAQCFPRPCWETKFPAAEISLFGNNNILSNLILNNLKYNNYAAPEAEFKFLEVIAEVWCFANTEFSVFPWRHHHSAVTLRTISINSLHLLITPGSSGSSAFSFSTWKGRFLFVFSFYFWVFFLVFKRRFSDFAIFFPVLFVFLIKEFYGEDCPLLPAATDNVSI